MIIGLFAAVFLLFIIGLAFRLLLMGHHSGGTFRALGLLLLVATLLSVFLPLILPGVITGLVIAVAIVMTALLMAGVIRAMF